VIRITPSGDCGRPGCPEHIGKVEDLRPGEPAVHLDLQWHSDHPPDPMAARTWTRTHYRGLPVAWARMRRNGRTVNKVWQTIGSDDVIVCPKCNSRMLSLEGHAAD
jgi:hypothetical protein